MTSDENGKIVPVPQGAMSMPQMGYGGVGLDGPFGRIPMTGENPYYDRPTEGAEYMQEWYRMMDRNGGRYSADEDVGYRLGGWDKDVRKMHKRAGNEARRRREEERLHGYMPQDDYFPVQLQPPMPMPMPFQNPAYSQQQQQQQHPHSAPQPDYQGRTPFVNPLETHHAPLGAHGIREHIPGQTHFRAEDFADRPDDPAGGYKWMKQREEMRKMNEDEMRRGER
jgi:hypothetical protein